MVFLFMKTFTHLWLGRDGRSADFISNFICWGPGSHKICQIHFKISKFKKIFHFIPVERSDGRENMNFISPERSDGDE